MNVWWNAHANMDEIENAIPFHGRWRVKEEKKQQLCVVKWWFGVMNRMNFKLANCCSFFHHPIASHHVKSFWLLSWCENSAKNARIYISNAKILTFEFKLCGMFVQWNEVTDFFALFGGVSLSKRLINKWNCSQFVQFCGFFPLIIVGDLCST